MHRKSTEVDRADRADGASGEYKVLEAVKMVRTCQNSLGQNGTHLGLLLLLVGPNGDGFGVRHLWNITATWTIFIPVFLL
jgi:hypothetical protein